MLEPIKGIEFLEEKHYYKVFGKFIPSVSSLIKPISSQIYSDIDKEVLKKAADRGTDIHLAIDVYDVSGAEIISEDYRNYFEAYKRFRADNPKLEVVASEYRVYEPALWYAGTIDKIFKDTGTGELILVDFKTSFAIEMSAVIPQLTGYERACKAQGIDITHCWVVHLKSDGTYEKVNIKTDFDLLINCIAIQNHIKKYKKGS